MATTTTLPQSGSGIRARALLNKVPEVTIWFWVIKILCTTVGESFADWVAVDLGVGLINTTVIFSVVLATVLTWQIRLPRYNAFSYWLTVVVLSVTGTLYTDILTDKYGVNLAITTPIVAVLLAAVFGIWYAREHTLSIHSITTIPREAFYWLAILVTFALGTAAGDWTLELTGWTPGTAVLLPLAPHPRRPSSGGDSVPTPCSPSGSPMSSLARSARTSVIGSQSRKSSADATSVLRARASSSSQRSLPR